MPVISPAPTIHWTRVKGAGQQEGVDMNDLSNEPIVVTDPEDEGEYCPLTGLDLILGSAGIMIAAVVVIILAVALKGLP
jgi:hypothetical protein